MEESDMSLNSKENADMTSDETKSDDSEAHSVSSSSDTSKGISLFEEKSSCSKPDDNSPQPLSLNNKPSKNCPDIASEPEVPSSVIDNDDRLSSSSDISKNSSSPSPPSSISSGDMDYYEDDEDLERFCEQEMSTLKGKDSGTEALKIEDGKFLECLASSNNETGTPTTEIELKGEEPAESPFNSSVVSPASSNAELHTSALNEHDFGFEHKVLMFFEKNPIVGEVVDRNELFTSRYFTDDFVLQHGLMVDENEVSIRNELEQDTAMESPESENLKSRPKDVKN